MQLCMYICFSQLLVHDQSVVIRISIKYSADLKNHIIKTSHYQGLKILNLQATHV